MATLIGDGSHAYDIRQTLDIPDKYLWQVHHHSGYNPKVHEGHVIVAINNPTTRAFVYRELGLKPMTNWIHPDAYVDRWTRQDLGRDVHINYRTGIVRTRIGDHVTIGPGVTICGDVTIGDRVLIGAGATICDRVTIGDDVTIGAGAVVLPETVIPDGETWVGVPARRIR